MKKSSPVDFQKLIDPILMNPEFARLGEISHHGNSILDHSLKVSRLAWKLAVKLKLDERSTARGALLHDFFLYDWKTGSSGRRRFYEIHKMHGFTHASEALKNAENQFELNRIERDIILRHMFPLTFRPPRYAESWVVTISDKLVALSETGHYFKYLLKYKNENKKI